MKKFISILLIISMLSAGVFTVAAESTDKAAKAAETRARIVNRLKLLEECKPLLEEIRENRIETLHLKLDVKDAYRNAKNRIRELRKAEDSLTEEQIAELKDAVKAVKEQQKNLKDTLGDIGDERVILKEAKKANDMEAYKKALEEVISIQEQRIDLLKNVIEDLGEIAVL